MIKIDNGEITKQDVVITDDDKGIIFLIAEFELPIGDEIYTFVDCEVGLLTDKLNPPNICSYFDIIDIETSKIQEFAEKIIKENDSKKYYVENRDKYIKFI